MMAPAAAPEVTANLHDWRLAVAARAPSVARRADCAWPAEGGRPARRCRHLWSARGTACRKPALMPAF